MTQADVRVTQADVRADYRSAERQSPFTFRVTLEEKARLRAEVAAEGLSSVQQLLELRVFGKAKPTRSSGRQRKHAQVDQLPISTD